jgi:glycosyltransferase involved in cell wall biosynthesis
MDFDMNKHRREIAFITGQLGLGGAERQLFLLATGLLQKGWQVSVINMSHQQGEYWEHVLCESKIPVHKIQMNLSRLHRLFEIRDILKATRISLVHSWTMHTNFYAAVGGRLAGIPIRMGSERANHHASRRALGRWYYLSLWGQDALITNSKQEAAFLQSHRPNLRVNVVPNGVEMPRDAMRLQIKQELRTRLGISTSSPIIGAVGSMVPRKNFSLLIQALKLLAKREVPFTLVLIGDGPLLSDLKQQATSCLPKDSCLFLGAIPNAMTWYAAFDIHCMTSINQEGMPNVVMEASAAGLPVVASNVAGVPELVEDGITGFLVEPNNINCLAEYLQKLMLDPNLRQRMGKAGREKMIREFSVEAMVARMVKIYEDVHLAKGLA